MYISIQQNRKNYRKNNVHDRSIMQEKWMALGSIPGPLPYEVDTLPVEVTHGHIFYTEISLITWCC